MILIENNGFDKYRILICGYNIINYLAKKSILASKDEEYIYLINFNGLFPEVI